MSAITDAGGEAWFHLLQVMTPLLLAVVSLLLAPFVVPFASRRFWQDDLQQLRSISETRVKTLEAVEKAVSVAAKAKTELGIDVTSCEIESELQQIIHEFAAPSVLSLEALEEWIKIPYKKRRFIDPKFTAPTEEARIYRRLRFTHKVLGFCFCLYLFSIPIFFTFFPNELKASIEYLAHKFSTPPAVVGGVILLALPLYFGVLELLGPRFRDRKARQALEKLRCSAQPGHSSRLAQRDNVIGRPPDQALDIAA